MYHSILNTNQTKLRDIWDLDVNYFNQHLKFLKEKENLIKPEELIDNIPETGVLITFDDGRRDFFETAAPVLMEHEVPFSLFVITNFLGSKDYISMNMLKELSNYKHASIGSHSMNHQRLTECSEEDLSEEIYGSKLFLEDILGKEIKMFSYPYGKFNTKVRDKVEEAGYKLGFTSIFDLNTASQDRLLLNRSEIWDTDDLNIFKQKLNGNWDWFKYRRFL
tara:strand:- start:592 stop:1254 length:663 start_codon:yes stop_codon:yes gene_type:complete